MPENWTQHKVENLIKEKVLSIGDGYRAKNSELSDDGLPFARAGNINQGFLFNNAECLDTSNLSKAREKISQSGDVVFTSKGTVGRFAFVKENTRKFVYSPQLCYWRVLDKDVIEPRFLYFWMNGQEFLQQSNGVKGLTDMADYVSLGNQRRFEITIPPIEEQRRIAEILTALDEKIELNLEMNRTLERIAQATFKHWFVDFQFPGFDGELVDGLPKGWRMGKLGEIIEVKNGYAFKGTDFINAGVPVLKIKNVKPNKILLNNLSYVSEEVAKKAEKYIIKKNTLLVTMSGNRIDGTPDTWVGKVGLFNENKKYLLNQRVSALELKDKFGHFLYYLTLLLSSEDFQYYFISNATSSGGQANISPTFINNSEILMPAVDVVKAYSKMVESIYLKTQENVNQIQTLTQIRDSLLPKLMSGKIRVTE